MFIDSGLECALGPILTYIREFKMGTRKQMFCLACVVLKKHLN